MTNVFEMLSELYKSKEWKDAIKKIDVDSIHAKADYDKYLSKKKPETEKLKQMTKLLYPIMKLMPALEDDDFIADPKDLANLEAMEKYFKACLNDKKSNLYGTYVALGAISSVKKQYTEAISYYEKALQAFPAKKEGFRFNPIDIYNNMSTIYYLEKKPEKTIEILTRKLALKSLSVEERKNTYLSLAKLYFEKSDLYNANEYAGQAANLGANFKTDFLLSHIFLRQAAYTLSDRYRQKASLKVTGDDICDFMSYIVVLHLSVGETDLARELYDSNTKNFNIECEECLEFLDRYTILK
jgi:tetratricopeptide (TPR) repeat protein